MPTRMCVACRSRQEAHTLLRMIARQDGQIWLSGEPERPPGRGASCCLKRACLKRISDQPNRLSQALRRSGLSTSDLLERADALHRLS